MNMQSNPVTSAAPLTAGEKAIVEAFEASAFREAGGARRKAIDAIRNAGLPTRRIEAWHYTDLKRLMTGFPPVAAETGLAAAEQLLNGTKRLFNTGRIAIIDGRHFAGASDAMPSGVTVKDARLQESVADTVDAIGTINSAFATGGVEIDIAAGSTVDTPIGLFHGQTSATPASTAVRHTVTVGKGAKARIVERHLSAAGSAGFANPVTVVSVGEGAELDYFIVQQQGSSATHLGQFRAKIARDAKLSLFIMNAGGKLVREEVIVAAEGEGGDFQLRAVNLLGGDTHADITMVLDHAAENTTSTELVRNVVTGKAHGVFQGRINVHQHAQKTDARMACNSLILSDDAEFSAKPELEIFADDVACGHGATVAEIDEAHLFYLMARGIPEQTGRAMLVKAFLAEVIEEMDYEPMVEALEAILEDWFAANV